MSFTPSLNGKIGLTMLNHLRKMMITPSYKQLDREGKISHPDTLALTHLLKVLGQYLDRRVAKCTDGMYET